MVAGATGIDLFLLVVDAGEGPRPQTHEHLAILRLLGIEHGVVAVTKADAVDDEVLELAVEGARARAGLRGGERQRAHGRRHRRAARCDRPRRGRMSSSARSGRPGPPVRRPRRSRCAASAPSSPERSGRARSAPETSWFSSPPASDVRVRSVQVHDRDVDAGGSGPASRGEPARSRALGRPSRRCAHRACRFPGLVPHRRRARGAGADSRRRSRPGSRRHGAMFPPAWSGRVSTTRSCGSLRRSSRPVATA